MYAKALGRFTTVDLVPITKQRLSYPQRVNLYAYGANSPVVFADTTGEDIIQVTRSSVAIQEEIDNFNQNSTCLPDDARSKHLNKLNEELRVTKVVESWMKELRAVGEDGGIQSNEISASTDPVKDLEGVAKAAGASVTAEERGEWASRDFTGTVIGGEIYMSANSGIFKGTERCLAGPCSTPRAGALSLADVATVGGSFVSHEKDHKKGEKLESAAYQKQADLLVRANSKRPFMNRTFFQSITNTLIDASKFARGKGR
jgi:hypothetical protein